MNRSRLKLRYFVAKEKSRLHDINPVSPTLNMKDLVRYIHNPSVHFKYEVAFKINLMNYEFISFLHKTLQLWII